MVTQDDIRSMHGLTPYFFSHKTGFFNPKQSKNLDPSNKTDLHFWIVLER